MKESAIQVLKVAPGEAPERITLENELSALQDAVSIGCEYRGLIEILSISEETCILCNEEGKLIGLAANRYLGSDILCGVFYVCGQNEEGDLSSLSREDEDYYKRYFALGSPSDVDENVQYLLDKFIWG